MSLKKFLFKNTKTFPRASQFLLNFWNKQKIKISPQLKEKNNDTEKVQAITSKSQKNKKFILCLDGGGSKSLVTNIILERIEKLIKEFDPNATLHSTFDLFSGTGLGGLSALLLAENPNTTSEELKKILILKSKNIFLPNKKTFYKFNISKYSLSGVENLIKEYFGNKKLNEISKPLVLTSFDLNSLKPIIISNLNSFKELSIVEVVLATTAIPIYFNSQRINYNEVTYNLIDGGVFANNPSFYALKFAEELFENVDEFNILSIGSYKNYENIENVDNPLLWTDITKKTRPPIQSVYCYGQEETTNQTLSFLKNTNYLRIDNKKGQFDDKLYPDSISEYDIMRMIDIGQKISVSYEGEIRKFLRNRFDVDS